MWIFLADASGAPGTEATGGTSVLSSHEYLPELLTKWPAETISRLTGLEPLVKNNRPPPGAKNACSVASSGTRSVPKVTSPRTFPNGLAKDFFEQPLGPIDLSVASVHVPKPCGWSFTPLGRKTFTADSGGIPPLGFWVVAP